MFLLLFEVIQHQFKHFSWFSEASMLKGTEQSFVSSCCLPQYYRLTSIGHILHCEPLCLKESDFKTFSRGSKILIKCLQALNQTYWFVFFAWKKLVCCALAWFLKAERFLKNHFSNIKTLETLKILKNVIHAPGRVWDACTKNQEAVNSMGRWAWELLIFKSWKVFRF